MRPIRVGVITYDWYPFDIRVRRMSEAAADAGYKVDVICLRQTGEKSREVCSGGVNVYRVPLNRDFDGSRPLIERVIYWCWFMILAGFVVTRLHLQRAYDVVHVHNMPDFLIFAALFPKLLGAKIILDVQDVTPELMAAKSKGRLRGLVTTLATWQEQISTKFADYVVTVGWPFEEPLLARGVPKEKLSSIINSADPKLFPASRRPLPPAETMPDESKPFIVMYHGTIAERNGLDIAIRAIAMARSEIPPLRLDILGRGEQLSYLKKLAAELDISDIVSFSDPCPSEKLVDFVIHGDVGIIPYRNDGFAELVLPTKAYEFAWMHRPIIASDTKAIRSMFRPESIVLCDPEKPESFAQAMIDLYQHPQKRAQMIDKAAQDYTPFRWEASAQCYQQLLLTLATTHLSKNNVQWG